MVNMETLLPIHPLFVFLHPFSSSIIQAPGSRWGFFIKPLILNKILG